MKKFNRNCIAGAISILCAEPVRTIVGDEEFTDMCVELANMFEQETSEEEAWKTFAEEYAAKQTAASKKYGIHMSPRENNILASLEKKAAELRKQYALLVHQMKAVQEQHDYLCAKAGYTHRMLQNQYPFWKL